MSYSEYDANETESGNYEVRDFDEPEPFEGSYVVATKIRADAHRYRSTCSVLCTLAMCTTVGLVFSPFATGIVLFVIACALVAGVHR